MKVYVSEKDRNTKVSNLSLDVRNELHNEIEKLRQARKNDEEFMGLTEGAFRWPVAQLLPLLDIEFVPGELTFFTFNNLRCQQDGVPSEVKRFDKLEDAIKEYNSLPREYTTALGGYLSETECIDFIHRRNGESVLVTDYRNMDHWLHNRLVQQALHLLVDRLGVAYESDLRSLGFDCPILVPVSNQTEINSYFKDKFLYPKFANRLNSAINEVYEEGEGWIPIEDFLDKLNNVSPYEDTYRPKITKYNVNYVDVNGRCGQADISPADFVLLKQQTERLTTRADLGEQIHRAASEVNSQSERGLDDTLVPGDR